MSSTRHYLLLHLESYRFFAYSVSSDALLRFWKARLGTFWDKDNSRKLCMGGMAAVSRLSFVDHDFVVLLMLLTVDPRQARTC